MGEVDTVVDDRDDQTGVALGDPERLRGVDVDVVDARESLDRLAGVVEAPLGREEGLSRGVDRGRPADVRLRVDDVRALPERDDGVREGAAVRAHDLDAKPPDVLQLLDPFGLPDGGSCGPRLGT